MNRPAASTKLPRAQSRPGPNDCSFASSKKRRARELPRKAIRGILRYLQKRNQEQHQHQAAAWRRHVALERFAAVGGTLLVFLGRERAEISCFQAPRAVFFFVQRAVKGESIVVSPGPGPFALPSSGVLVPTRETYGKIEWKNPYCILHPHTVSGTPRALEEKKEEGKNRFWEERQIRVALSHDPRRRLVHLRRHRARYFVSILPFPRALGRSCPL